MLRMYILNCLDFHQPKGFFEANLEIIGTKYFFVKVEEGDWNQSLFEFVSKILQPLHTMWLENPIDIHSLLKLFLVELNALSI